MVLSEEEVILKEPERLTEGLNIKKIFDFESFKNEFRTFFGTENGMRLLNRLETNPKLFYKLYENTIFSKTEQVLTKQQKEELIIQIAESIKKNKFTLDKEYQKTIELPKQDIIITAKIKIKGTKKTKIIKYKKAKPRRFTLKQKRWVLKNSSMRNNKQITVLFNRNFKENRSVSSISTLKYRVRGTKK